MAILAEEELKQRLAKVKLLVLDVDGVLTDGGLYYTETGDELKKFNVKDGMGIKKVMQAGINVAIITTSTSAAVMHRAKKLGISHVYLGAEDKLAALKELARQLQISMEYIAYMGDDANDLPVMQAVGCPMTVADAMPENLAHAVYITRKAGGQGAVREVCDLL
jgi:3-deoxy-D-manno-octulosonate 8-phosphate phosphatase (KDO 8-P phosphatase)